MTSTPFPKCCGIQIFCGFGNTITALDTTKYTKEEIDSFIKSNERYLFSDASVMIVLNNEQMDAIGDVVLANGFAVINQAYHPAHKTEIFILIKNLNDAKRPPKA